MHIHRDHSRLSFRRHRRRSSGLSMMVIVGVLVGIGAVSWNWIGQRLTFGSAPVKDNFLGLAQAAFANGNLNDAVRYAQQAFEQDTNNSDVLIVLARSLIYRSYSDYDRAIDRDSALELTTEALARSPNDPKLLAIPANGGTGAARIRSCIGRYSGLYADSAARYCAAERGFGSF